MRSVDDKASQLFERHVREISFDFAIQLDRILIFAIFDGYPWDDIAVVEHYGLMKTEVYYDPFHEIIDMRIGGLPDYSQCKQLGSAILSWRTKPSSEMMMVMDEKY